MSAAAVENLLKSALNTAKLESYGRGGGGCINEGEGFLTDHGPVFVKKNRKSEVEKIARVFFILQSIALLYRTGVETEI